MVALGDQTGQGSLDASRLLVEPALLGLRVGDGFGRLVALSRETGEPRFKLAHLLVETGLFSLAAGQGLVELSNLLLQRLAMLLGSGGIGQEPVVLGLGLRDRLFGLVALGR